MRIHCKLRYVIRTALSDYALDRCTGFTVSNDIMSDEARIGAPPMLGNRVLMHEDQDGFSRVARLRFVRNAMQHHLADREPFWPEKWLW